MAKYTKSILFTAGDDPEIVGLLNELAQLEDRKVRDSARRLILTAGRVRIGDLKKEQQNGKAI